MNVVEMYLNHSCISLKLQCRNIDTTLSSASVIGTGDNVPLIEADDKDADGTVLEVSRHSWQKWQICYKSSWAAVRKNEDQFNVTVSINIHSIYWSIYKHM